MADGIVEANAGPVICSRFRGNGNGPVCDWHLKNEIDHGQMLDPATPASLGSHWRRFDMESALRVQARSDQSYISGLEPQSLSIFQHVHRVSSGYRILRVVED